MYVIDCIWNLNIFTRTVQIFFDRKWRQKSVLTANVAQTTRSYCSLHAAMPRATVRVYLRVRNYNMTLSLLLLLLLPTASTLTVFFSAYSASSDQDRTRYSAHVDMSMANSAGRMNTTVTQVYMKPGNGPQNGCMLANAYWRKLNGPPDLLTNTPSSANDSAAVQRHHANPPSDKKKHRTANGGGFKGSGLGGGWTERPTLWIFP